MQGNDFGKKKGIYINIHDILKNKLDLLTPQEL